jgi:hypothetical protein
MKRFRSDRLDWPSHSRIDAKYQVAAKRLALDLPGTPHRSTGAPATATAIYLEHNVFGTPTGRKVEVNEGEPMARAAPGYTWLLPEAHMLKRPSQ